MTPPPPIDDGPREAATRLYTLCGELKHRQWPGGQVEELRAL